MTVLHVPAFTGVVLEGAADQRTVSELLEADSFDLGTRGALVAASDIATYTQLIDGAGPPVPVTVLRALLSAATPTMIRTLAVSDGTYVLASTYLLTSFPRATAGPQVSPNGGAFPICGAGGFPGVPVARVANGIVVTGATFAGTFAFRTTLIEIPPYRAYNVFLVCLGAREGTPAGAGPGLYVVLTNEPAGGLPLSAVPIGSFSALGTGPYNSDATLGFGTLSKQLYARGVVAYNNHAFVWGYDSADVVNFEGPNRVMFCNLGNPLAWGNDNQGVAGTDRAFTDSDAIVLGDAGEIIRGALVWNGKLFFGTNRGLHYIAGYGRDSFITDGSTPVMRAYNITGAHSMIEGPDKLLYGVSDQGLWSFDGAGVPVALFDRLTNFDGRSPGYWDLIWSDPTRPAGEPGKTNQDLIWTAVDWGQNQVLIGIPYCNATVGAGWGSDTVVIKYHPASKGFTRQVFPEQTVTCAGYFRRQGQEPEVKFMGGRSLVKRYGYSPTQTGSPPMPSVLPAATFGPFAPFGPDGRGAVKRVYLTVAWESAAALPIVFTVTTTWDQRTSDSFQLTLSSVAPGAPATNDLWLDTSLTDTNLGNGTAGALVGAFPEALLRRWSGLAWQQVLGVGSNGTRATMRLPLDPRNGTRVTVRVQCTAGAGRFQLEGIGQRLAGGSQAE